MHEFEILKILGMIRTIEDRMRKAANGYGWFGTWDEFAKNSKKILKKYGKNLVIYDVNDRLVADWCYDGVDMDLVSKWTDLCQEADILILREVDGRYEYIRGITILNRNNDAEKLDFDFGIKARIPGKNAEKEKGIGIKSD